jgi:hypothetical protein
MFARSGVAVDFKRSDLRHSMQQLAASVDVYERSIGFNYTIEENVGPARQNHLENFDPAEGEVRALVDSYYRGTIEGLVRGHLPSTFDEVLNSDALLSASVESNQKIVRLERIDALINRGGLDFARLVTAVGAHDSDDISALTDLFTTYPGERPVFAAFKSEVEKDLADPDWLQLLIDRLGLLHFYPFDSGLTYSFALMEYTAEEVIASARRAGISQCFAVATALECRNNPAFFPVPRGSSQGFTVDLRHRAISLQMLREILHVRIDYDWRHVMRLGRWTGAVQPDIEAARTRHLAALRTNTGRAGFGDIAR